MFSLLLSFCRCLFRRLQSLGVSRKVKCFGDFRRQQIWMATNNSAEVTLEVCSRLERTISMLANNTSVDMVKGCSPWWENMASLGASINPLAKWLWHFFAVSIFPFSRFRCTKKGSRCLFESFCLFTRCEKTELCCFRAYFFSQSEREF